MVMLAPAVEMQVEAGGRWRNRLATSRRRVVERQT